MPGLDVRGLRKDFGAQSVLRELNFRIDPGEVYGLVGPNGAGKTTAINIICDLVAPDGGAVSWQDRPIAHSSRRMLGVVPQEIALYRDLTAAQNLEFFAGLYGLRAEAKRSAAQRALGAVGLENHAGKPASVLSGGQQRRLHFAIALLHEPPLLVFDEPTVGLDLEARHRIWELIRDTARRDRTVLLTTHNLEEAEVLCSRVGILDGGRIVAEGTLPELRRRIPAEGLAQVQADDLRAVCERATQHGLAHRSSGATVTLRLPRQAGLEEVAAMFRGIPLRSLSLKPVGLEEVFVEVTEQHHTT